MIVAADTDLLHVHAQSACLKLLLLTKTASISLTQCFCMVLRLFELHVGAT